MKSVSQEQLSVVRSRLPVGQARAALYGDQNTWQQKTYTITGSGTHTVKWTFSRSSDEENSGMGYVDCVQWSGSALPAPEPPIDRWHRLAYQYDAAGRRVEKKYNNVTVLKYIYDGDHCIAEYDGSNNLRRKYIYGPGVDQPISMIEAAGSYAGTYYYHFDGLGSVVALTNASGNTVEVYEYETYGRVGASDASHPNRILFTGREYDKETGLYYYRARYYNPQIGRFLQTDPIGYGAGMNWYAYCGNSPIGLTDPSGLWADYTFQWIETGGGPRLGVECLNADGGVGTDFYFTDWLDLFDYVNGTGKYMRPGDFCDGNFDRAVFNASLDAAQAADPTYGTGGAEAGTPPSSGSDLPYNPQMSSPAGPEMRDLLLGELGHILGARGAQTNSTTLWNGKGRFSGSRIDVENPKPGMRDGQIHYQEGGEGAQPYKFNPQTGRFDGLSEAKNSSLLSDPKVRRAIERGMRQYLGERNWKWPKTSL